MGKFQGESLKHLRILFAYSQPKLAEITKISELDIMQYENGIKQPTFSHINTFKALFGVKSKYFYQDDILKDKSTNINPAHMSLKLYY